MAVAIGVCRVSADCCGGTNIERNRETNEKGKAENMRSYYLGSN
jgi:hypothetical protein